MKIPGYKVYSKLQQLCACDNLIGQCLRGENGIAATIAVTAGTLFAAGATFMAGGGVPAAVIAGTAALLAGAWKLGPDADNNVDWRAPVCDKESKTAATMAALIQREVSNGWIVNAPRISPAQLFDNKHNFQLGMYQAWRLFAAEMRDQVFRLRGSSAKDTRLDAAAQELAGAPDAWLINITGGGGLVGSRSETVFMKAARALTEFNKDVASGKVASESRADNLAATLERVGSDLGDCAAKIEAFLETKRLQPLNTKADDLFYQNMGKAFAYYHLVGSMGDDFAEILKSRNSNEIWATMNKALRETASLKPLVVMDGKEMSLFANHLGAQGFHLQRARQIMNDLSHTLRM